MPSYTVQIHNHGPKLNNNNYNNIIVVCVFVPCKLHFLACHIQILFNLYAIPSSPKTDGVLYRVLVLRRESKPALHNSLILLGGYRNDDNIIPIYIDIVSQHTPDQHALARGNIPVAMFASCV